MNMDNCIPNIAGVGGISRPPEADSFEPKTAVLTVADTRAHIHSSGLQKNRPQRMGRRSGIRNCTSKCQLTSSAILARAAKDIKLSGRPAGQWTDCKNHLAEKLSEGAKNILKHVMDEVFDKMEKVANYQRLNAAGDVHDDRRNPGYLPLSPGGRASSSIKFVMALKR